MKKLDLQKIIREEVKKALNENYRDAKENIAILHAMLKKGGKEATYVKDIFKDIKSEMAIVMSLTDAKANLKLANKVPELDEYLDNAVEDALDDGMGRVKGMYSMSGMREATVKKDDLDKIGDFVMSSPQFEKLSSSKIKAAIKDMHDEWKAVASNYKSIEDYFDEIEETGGEEAFMESKKPSKSKKTLKEGYAWERSERKFGDPLPTLASVQKAHQAKQKMTEIGAFPTGPGRMTALRMNKSYSILDAGTDEWNEYKYLGEIGQGSTAGNPGEHMFYATDAPGVYVFIALSEEDLKTMIKEA